MKAYAANTILAHNYDVWFSPRQMILDPNLYPGRMNPTLDFVYSFEIKTLNNKFIFDQDNFCKFKEQLQNLKKAVR